VPLIYNFFNHLPISTTNSILFVISSLITARGITGFLRDKKHLQKLQEERKVSYLFISHDPAVVRHMSDQILVMKDGKALIQ
jgi:ABC-type polysaccharide/polyol phosphate transport system ATPase subunit